jgi:hypothetical protein
MGAEAKGIAAPSFHTVMGLRQLYPQKMSQAVMRVRAAVGLLNSTVVL